MNHSPNHEEGCEGVLTVTPIDFAEANAFVAELHRHHKPMPGCKFCIAVSDEEGKVRGVAMVGRPVARLTDNGWTLEVNRVCTETILKNNAGAKTLAAGVAEEMRGIKFLVSVLQLQHCEVRNEEAT
jgi:hypothetical protein